MHVTSGLLFQSQGGLGPDSGLSVLGLASDSTACGKYRVEFPLRALAARGARVTARALGPGCAPLDVGDLLTHDCVLIQRHHDRELLLLLERARRAVGTVVVYDLDDYLHGVPPASPAFPLYDPRSEMGARTLSGIEAFLLSADATLFSTRELGALYQGKTRLSFVLPNGLDVDDARWNVTPYDWRGDHVGPEIPLVGVSGGSTHLADWKTLGPSITRILQESRAHIGIHAQDSLAAELFKRWGVPEDRQVLLPLTRFEDYPSVLSAFDVILAPLQACRFSYAKSALRILEPGLLGIPYVASAVAPFHRVHRASGGEGGFLASGTDFASPALRLLADAGERKARGESLRAFVQAKCSSARSGALLSYALKAALLSRNGGSLPDPVLVADSAMGIPTFHFPVRADGPCPCGCGRPYKRGCCPAYGRL